MGYEKLPAPWSKWMPALGVGPPPPERRASCATCVMCSDDDWTARMPALRYRVDTRCCTYLPGLWNFQVGGALASEETSPAVREALERRIDSGLASPLGVAPAFDGDDSYKRLVESDGFGRSDAVVCPYHEAETGNCGVWKHRNAVCATWHCRHERGMIGLGYWTALRRLIDLLEIELSQRALRALLPENDGSSWDGWDGTRSAWYRACWQLVSGLDPHAFVGSLPAELRQAVSVVAVGERSLADLTFPERATLHEVSLVDDMGGGRVRVSGYTSVDTAVIPVRLYKVLDWFDGRPLSQVRDDLASFGVAVDDVTLRRLIDIDVLR